MKTLLYCVATARVYTVCWTTGGVGGCVGGCPGSCSLSAQSLQQIPMARDGLTCPGPSVCTGRRHCVRCKQIPEPHLAHAVLLLHLLDAVPLPAGTAGRPAARDLYHHHRLPLPNLQLVLHLQVRYY